MIPYLRLYAYLGQRLAAQTTPDSPYREWVMPYSSARFEALARRLEGLLDRYGRDHDRSRRPCARHGPALQECLGEIDRWAGR
jgi:thiaminase/transcriptional activator TenA